MTSRLELFLQTLGFCQHAMADWTDWWMQQIDERVDVLRQHCILNHNRLFDRITDLENRLFERVTAMENRLNERVTELEPRLHAAFITEIRDTERHLHEQTAGLTLQIADQSEIIDGIVDSIRAAGTHNAPLAIIHAAPVVAPVAEPAAPVAAMVAAPTAPAVSPEHPELILVEWMVGHRFYKPPVNRSPPPPDCAERCNHGEHGWFLHSFNDQSHEANTCFASGNDVPVGGHDWSKDRLNSHAQRAADAFNLDQQVLYDALCIAEGLFIAVHMPNNFGEYSVRFGCNRCMAMTPEYQPQYEMKSDGKTKDLRHSDDVKSAFRAFISLVINIDLIEVKCKHHYGTSSGSGGRVGGMQAIANDANAHLSF